jgi:hypothetical protein
VERTTGIEEVKALRIKVAEEDARKKALAGVEAEAPAGPLGSATQTDDASTGTVTGAGAAGGGSSESTMDTDAPAGPGKREEEMDIDDGLKGEGDEAVEY